MMNLLGVLGIILFCAVIIALAAGITWVVVRLLPVKKKQQPPAAGAES